MRGARRTRNVCRCARAAGPGVPEPRAVPLPPLAMAPPAACRSPMSPPPPPLLLLLLLSLALLGARARAEPAGSAVPAQSRPCVDCHAFEFMQRALQDLRKTACSLDARTETLLLQAERRALCACWPAGR
ncbi:LOW QUALITY PROTEIN: neuropeptide-like protein C4orf48 homolog [Trachypithecus francoisi]|uniref:LOW QUALITY PROTEIN: neuropeptide-like protein C4orf48 homolog n=1 Tax=Trachypithecus francoisi TaxID=54180 RepID=UPI00141AF701|nr:LOW QUALITY PROTEIN: neuropeptide-like protein C4orf48 homolog [Trachypithecus francoisi]